METMLSESGFKSVTRLEATDGRMGNKSAAISTSHRRALEEVRAMGTPAIIMEDDCVLMDFKPVITIPDDTEAFYLGTSIAGLETTNKTLKQHLVGRNSIRPISEDVFKIDGMNSTHAILYLSPEYVDMSIRVCEQGERTGLPHDLHLNHIQELFNVYCFKSPLFGNASGMHTTGKDATHEPAPPKRPPTPLKERRLRA